MIWATGTTNRCKRHNTSHPHIRHNQNYLWQYLWRAERMCNVYCEHGWGVVTVMDALGGDLYSSPWKTCSDDIAQKCNLKNKGEKIYILHSVTSLSSSVGWMFRGMLLAKTRCKEVVLSSREKGYVKRHPCDENFDNGFLPSVILLVCFSLSCMSFFTISFCFIVWTDCTVRLDTCNVAQNLYC